MDEQKIKKLIKQEMDKNYISGTPRIPPHIHNGIDGLRISQKDVTPDKKFLTSASTFFTAGDFTLDFVPMPNCTKIEFHGFAANNADGSPATLRSHINGVAYFGDVGYVRSVSNEVSVTVPSSKVIQTCNYIYTGTNAAATRVGAASDYFAYATNGTIEVVVAQITLWDGAKISGTVSLDTNWRLYGSFIFS